MACIYLLAEKDKCLWHPFIPTAHETAPSRSSHVGESLLLPVCLGLRMTPGSGCEHTHSPRTAAEPTPTPVTGISTNYMEKQRLICSLEPVTQHLCNGNLIACWFTFTRKWWCLWEEITFFLTGKANYLRRVCFIFHTPSSVGLTHAHLRAHYLLIDVRALCV